jgi:ABC-2 type transport system ATP-binding protein
MGDPIVVFNSVSKRFGSRHALVDVSLGVRRGEILMLAGHNGAGKSTLLALAVGLLRPTRGEIHVGGVSMRRHPAQARYGVGCMLASAFHDHLSGRDNLRLLTTYSGGVDGAEIDAIVALVGLADRIDDPVRTYSHGMRGRLALAQALLPAPQVLLLDEPEEGLDPEATRDMRSTIRRINRERGVTVVLASHQLGGDDQACDRLALLERGRLAFVGGWNDVDDRPTLRLEVDDWEKARPILARAGAAVVTPGVVRLSRDDDEPDLVAALVHAGVRVRAAEPSRRTAAELYARVREAHA